MSEDYRNGDSFKRHQSPTRRLIQQKNSTWEHKELLRRNTSPSKSVYDLCYTTEPGRSYVIEPEGGQLDYELARKNPGHFYD